jgi:cell division protein FtsW
MQISWVGNNRKILICIVATLLAIGVIMVYSSTAFGLKADPTYKLRKQALWAAIATVCMVLAWHTDYRLYARHRKLIIGVAILLLFAVYLPGIGRQVNGAHRWLRVTSLSIQPSELAKLAMIIYIAATLSELGDGSRRFVKGFLPLAGVVGIVTLLVLVEPDFGTGAFIAFISIMLMFIGGVRIFHIAAFGTLALVPLLAVLALKFEHVRSRLSVFFNADADPLGRGYQIKQSLIALGSGGLFGIGLGESRQKLMFLPEPDTDFIFSILGEELGFVGAALVVVLFMLFLCYGMKIASRCKDLYSYLLAVGITVAISAQAVLNIAVVTGSVPPKGIALPLLSFGGSSLVTTMIAVGILLNIAKQNQLPHSKGAERLRPRDDNQGLSGAGKGEGL